MVANIDSGMANRSDRTEDNDTTSSGNVTPKPSELVPLARSPIKNPSTQHVQDTVMVDPEGK